MSHLSKILCVILATIAAVIGAVVRETTLNKFESDDDLKVKSDQTLLNEKSKQLFVSASGKDTNPPNFWRLVAMRLIYGLASTMGLEDRLESALNGVFVPPNAQDGFGGFDDDDGLLGGFGEAFDDY